MSEDHKTTALAVVPTKTVGQRVQALQAEARVLAREHVMALCTAIASAEALATEIAEGGDAYPPGVRDLARRFAEDAETRVQSLEAIAARNT